MKIENNKKFNTLNEEIIIDEKKFLNTIISLIDKKDCELLKLLKHSPQLFSTMDAV